MSNPPQVPDLSQFSGYWCRFSRYEWNGASLVPAPGAEPEKYDPWEQFSGARKKGKGGGSIKRPYESLLDLADTSRITRSFESSEEGHRQRILDWCNENGLLGLFFLRVRQVTLYPRWEVMGQEDTKVMAVQRRFFRSPTNWRQVSQSSANVDARVLPPERKPEGDLVPKEYWDRRWAEPGVVWEEISFGQYGMGYESQPISHVMPHYFPTIPPSEGETYLYPNPTTPEFWELYGEPGHWIIRSAQWFSDILRGIVRIKPAEEMTDHELRDILGASEELEALAALTKPILYPVDEGGYTQKWFSTCLLSSFAMMALLDAANGLLNNCDNCDKLFVSSAARARFCSARCRNAVQRREWRARKAEQTKD